MPIPEDRIFDDQNIEDLQDNTKAHFLKKKRK
jgi:hypothetical protein